MNKHIHLAVDRIETSTPVLGVHIEITDHTGRIDDPYFRCSVPGYKQITITHDGSNLLFSQTQKQTWVTKLAHFRTLESYKQYTISDDCIFTLQADDTVTRVEVGLCTIKQPPTDDYRFGLWQIITFKRPGVSGRQLLPRLLVQLDRPDTSTLH